MPTVRNMPLATAALAAALLLAVGAGAAKARNLSLSNQNTRVTWRSLEFVSAGFATVRCPVTLESSLHTRTIAKVQGSLIGAINVVLFKRESCTNGRVLAKGLQWHETYAGFFGSLPNVAALVVDISRFRFLFDVFGCTSGEYGTATDAITLSINREAGGGLTSVQPVAGRNTMSLVAAREFCPATATLAGTGEIMASGTATRVTLTLI